MTEEISRASFAGELPQVDADPRLVEKFLRGNIHLEELRQIKPEALEALKRERYVPYSGKDICDLPVLEAFARKMGRVSVEEPMTLNEVYSRFGHADTLKRTFQNEVGLDQRTLVNINNIVRQVASIGPYSVKEDCLVVIDDGGIGKTIRAYEWPFMGIQFSVVTTKSPSVENIIKGQLKEVGEKPWRVGTFELMPGNIQTQRYATVCVFVGK